MIFHSASYNYSNPNFVIQNLNYNKYCDKITPSVCVLKNILTRGVSISISKYLNKHLKIKCTSKENMLYLVSNSPAYWDKSIKGGTDNEGNYYNPALEFYKKNLPNIFKNYGIQITNLFLPETYFSYIGIGEKKDAEYSFDFYLPQANLAIEIDGSQHNLNNERINDINKEECAKNHDIEVIRIDAKNVSNIDSYQKQIRDRLKDNRYVKNITSYCHDEYESFIDDLKSSYVIRLQMFFLDLLQYGIITLEDDVWNINIKVDDPFDLDIKEISTWAFEDIQIWFTHLLNMQQIENNFPQLNITTNNIEISDGINVNISILKRWDDEAKKHPNTFYIRNDYKEFDFTYRDELDKKYANYFIVNTAKKIIYKSIKIDDLSFFLENIFGYEFREGQFGIIKTALEGNDTIGILPTGGGKSICYQLVSILQPCVNFSVCPLKSLMDDQMRNIKKYGFKNIQSIRNYDEIQQSNRTKKYINNFAKKKYIQIWISPERFQISEFRDCLREIYKTNEGVIATIDEVHCLSEWGHDFRISYLCLIKTIRDYCHNATLLGLTATASPAVIRDLKIEMNISNANVISKLDMNRDNLNFNIIKVKCNKINEKIDALNNILIANNCFEEHNNTLVFTKTAQNIYEDNKGCLNFSREYNLSGCFYGDLNEQIKEENTEKFINGSIRVMFATKAFGMGMDKSDIRNTIHYGMPSSLESLYQEAGRAGRDNEPANCYVICAMPENEKIADTIVNPSTPLKILHEISDYHNYKYNGDISNCLYFFKTSNPNIDIQIEIIEKVYSEIKINPCLSIKDIYHVLSIKNIKEGEFTSYFDKALYRLFVLGIIKDWTIDYRTRNYSIDYNEKESPQNIEKKMFEYFLKRESGFSINGESELEKELKKIYDDQQLNWFEKYVRMLLIFSYKKFSYKQLSNINQVYTLCNNFKDSQSFKDIINQEFKVDIELGPLYNYIIENDKNVDIWFKVLDKRNQENIDASISKYTSDYQLNAGINYISGMIHLLNDDFDNIYGRERFISCLKSIKKNSKENIDKILEYTFKCVYDCPIKIKNQLAECLIQEEICEPSKIYKSIEDEYSISMILLITSEKIIEIGEKINDCFR